MLTSHPKMNAIEKEFSRYSTLASATKIPIVGMLFECPGTKSNNSDTRDYTRPTSQATKYAIAALELAAYKPDLWDGSLSRILMEAHTCMLRWKESTVRLLKLCIVVNIWAWTVRASRARSATLCSRVGIRCHWEHCTLPPGHRCKCRERQWHPSWSN